MEASTEGNVEGDVEGEGVGKGSDSDRGIEIDLGDGMRVVVDREGNEYDESGGPLELGRCICLDHGSIHRGLEEVERVGFKPEDRISEDKISVVSQVPNVVPDVVIPEVRISDDRLGLQVLKVASLEERDQRRSVEDVNFPAGEAGSEDVETIVIHNKIGRTRKDEQVQAESGEHQRKEHKYFTIKEI